MAILYLKFYSMIHWTLRNVLFHFHPTFVTFEDKEPPLFTNKPRSVTVNTTSKMPYAIVTWTEPTVSDNSGSHKLAATHWPGSKFPIGTTRVTYAAFDDAGNKATFSFEVTVEGNNFFFGSATCNANNIGLSTEALRPDSLDPDLPDPYPMMWDSKWSRVNSTRHAHYT